MIISSDPTVGLDEARFALFDARDAQVYLAELGMVPPGATNPVTRPARQSGGRFRPSGRGQRDDRNQRGRDQRPQRQPPPSAAEDSRQDKYDAENVEEELDRRDRELTESDADRAPQSIDVRIRRPIRRSPRAGPRR